ncbi:MAG: GFA family protein [Rhizobiaceae bacterium]
MIHKGSCLCGAVSFTVNGSLRPLSYCHCTQCRKQTGHFYAATAADDEEIRLNGEANVTWYQSSATARRGFCSRCGSALFWKHDRSKQTSILAGSLDKPTGLKADRHIFCADKGDYYTIDDGLPVHEAY